MTAANDDLNVNREIELRNPECAFVFHERLPKNTKYETKRVYALSKLFRLLPQPSRSVMMLPPQPIPHGYVPLSTRHQP